MRHFSNQAVDLVITISKFIGFMGWIFSPVFGAIYSVYAIIYKKSPSYIAFSLSMALIYSYLPVLWDARNNFLHLTFDNLEGSSLYILIFDFWLNDQRLPFIGLLFLFGAISIYILSKSIAHSLYLNDYNYVGYFLCALLFFMTIEYRYVFDLQRNHLALALIIGGINVRSRQVKWIFFTAAIMTHLFVVSVIFAIYAAKIIKNNATPLLWVVVAISAALAAAAVDSLSIISPIIPFAQNRLEIYAALNETRFSSSAIALTIWLMRYISFIVVAYVMLKMIPLCQRRDLKTIIKATILCCIAAILTSRNEVFSERNFMTILLLTAYISANIHMPTKYLVFIVMIMGINILAHGVKTLILVFSDKYTVIGDEGYRIDAALMLLKFPTIMLLDFESGPYSNANLITGL